MSANTATQPDVTPDRLERGSSLWLDAWHRLRKNHLAVTGLIFIIVIALASLVGTALLDEDSYRSQNLDNKLLPPSTEHLLGTDHLGRDQLARILYGGRISLSVGLIATAVSLTIGVVYGTTSGFLGGKVDAVMMRIVDILYALPFTIFVILLMVFAKDFGDLVEDWLRDSVGLNTDISTQWNLILLFGAIGAVEWLTMARIVRGQVQSLKRQEFVEAGIALGLSKRRLIFRHMIPNVLGPVIIYTTLTIPAVMLLEAFLSFLGLGVQAPMSSWGIMIKEGQERMEEAWWMLVFPGLVFALTLFSLNFLGDGLRDALDPRTSKD